MPTFTFDKTEHPFLSEEPERKFYLVDILLPGWEDHLVTVSGYIGQFKKSIMSSVLATRLGADVTSGYGAASIVVQSWFDGDLVIHRSKPFEILFGKSSRERGEAYFHIDTSHLDSVFFCDEFDAIRPNGNNLYFLAIKPRGNPEVFCSLIPIERFEDDSSSNS
jgi:hypothetical protein